jgi:hypothetical protein
MLPPVPKRETKDSGKERGSQEHEDDLDRHVQEVLGHREKLRRTLKGVWSFVKTRMFVSEIC